MVGFRVILAASLVLLAVAACLSGPPGPPSASGGNDASAVQRDPLVFASGIKVNSGSEAPLNPDLVATEPSIEVAPDGTFWIAGPTGLLTPAFRGDPRPYTHDSGLWFSKDGGSSWQWSETIPGYGRDLCPGGGDSDIEISPDGTIFLADLWLGSVTLSVSRDGGKSWICNPVASPVPIVDRQWLALHGDDAVYLLFNQIGSGAVLLKANRLGAPVDGLVFAEIARFDQPAFGKPQVDQRDGTLYVPVSGLQVSTDGGKTFEDREGGSWGLSGVATDDDGNIYSSDRVSRDQGQTWTNTSAQLGWQGNWSHPFVWHVAGARGVLNLAWYGKPDVPPPAGPGWYLYFAQTTDALGEKDQNARFEVVQVSEKPVLTIDPCFGLGCGDGRALGDFFEMDLDRDGSAVVGYNDAVNYASTTLLFAKQVAGPKARSSPPG